MTTPLPSPGYVEIEPQRDQIGRVLFRLFNDTLSRSTFSVDENDGQTIEGQLAKLRAVWAAAQEKQKERVAK